MNRPPQSGSQEDKVRPKTGSNSAEAAFLQAVRLDASHCDEAAAQEEMHESHRAGHVDAGQVELLLQVCGGRDGRNYGRGTETPLALRDPFRSRAALREEFG